MRIPRFRGHPTPQLARECARSEPWSRSSNHGSGACLPQSSGPRRCVVGWATSSNNDTTLALDALQAALKARSPLPGLLHHSDRFATLRAELVDHEHYAARYEAKLSIGDYIDNFYNVERRHSSLGYLNPIEFELRSKNQQCVA